LVIVRCGIRCDGVQPPAPRRLGRRLLVPIPAVLHVAGRRSQFAERPSRLGQRPSRRRPFVADAGQRFRPSRGSVHGQQPLHQLPQLVAGQTPDPLLQFGPGSGGFGQGWRAFRGGRDQVLVHLEKIGQSLQGRRQFAQPRGHRGLPGFILAGTRQPSDVQRTQVAAEQQLPDGRKLRQCLRQPVPDLIVRAGIRIGTDFEGAVRPVLRTPREIRSRAIPPDEPELAGVGQDDGDPNVGLRSVHQ
jgi:hypothetical protein